MGEMTEVGKLKEGRFIMIDDEPCRIVGFSTSPLRKHGHANAKISAVDRFIE